MRIRPFFRGAFLCFYLLSLLLSSATFCYGDHQEESKIEVVGFGECADCAESNIKTSQALSGLRITVDCKPANGEFKTRGVGELDEQGKFKVNLPSNLATSEGKLKEECYAQLHSASAAPCPTHSGLESSKIVLKSKNNEKQTFGLAGKLKFSPVTCTSAFLWPHYKYPLLHKFPPLKSFGHHHSFPPKVFPPLPPKHYHPLPPKYFPPKPLPPPVPIYKPPPKVYPPPVPIYKPPPKVYPPPVPIYKPPPKVFPPPVPIYKPPPKVFPPPVPIYKPPPKVFPPPVPIYKPPPKVYPPPVPIYKPPPKPCPPKPPVYKPPVYKPTPKPPVYYNPPPVPIYKPIPKPPIVYKPLPPLHKKPCPPLPKLPPFPKIPPKYFHHPKFGKKWPPLPPYSPIH